MVRHWWSPLLSILICWKLSMDVQAILRVSRMVQKAIPRCFQVIAGALQLGNLQASFDRNLETDMPVKMLSDLPDHQPTTSWMRGTVWYHDRVMNIWRRLKAKRNLWCVRGGIKYSGRPGVFNRYIHVLPESMLYEMWRQFSDFELCTRIYKTYRWPEGSLAAMENVSIKT